MALSLFYRILCGRRESSVQATYAGGVGSRLSLRDAAREHRRGGETTIREVVAVFGRAQLVLLADGRHQLLGGSVFDRTQAREWISLFGHEVLL